MNSGRAASIACDGKKLLRRGGSKLASLNHVGLTVTDLEASQSFYVGVVGMEVVQGGYRNRRRVV
jgi:catechol-2,3-dioxygenase